MGRERLSALTIPWCTFTDPEVAHVGIHEEEAIRRDMDINTFSIDMKDLDRAITEGIKDGLIKIHVKGGSDQIVGATIVGHNAGELISHISMAIASNIGLKKIANVVYPYPVLTEAIHKIADSYNMTRLTSPVKGLSSMWLDLTG
jgi:pyruvate/2-oxoglutarate dehydrogenase complex dihydrolipoamide dehydrogenase (E3) component